MLRLARPARLFAAAVAAGCVAFAAPVAQARHSARHSAGYAHEAQPGEFDYYLLSMSWSPTYCLVHPHDQEECGRVGYGLVVHGLWPQFDEGGWPEDCATRDRLSADDLRRGLTLFPSERLLRHEWNKHGTCSGLGPAGYLRALERASAIVQVPAALQAPAHAQSYSPAQLERLVLAANPGLPADGLRLQCTDGRLAEIRACVTRELTPRACGARVPAGCRGSTVLVPAVR